MKYNSDGNMIDSHIMPDGTVHPGKDHAEYLQMYGESPVLDLGFVTTNSSGNKLVSGEEGAPHLLVTHPQNVAPIQKGEEAIDNGWEYFVSNPGDVEDVDELEKDNDIFITTSEIKTTDPHYSYITRGPYVANNGLIPFEEMFCVYLIIDDVAYPIPDYKTLEVLLVQKGQTYDDIVIATSKEKKKYDLDMDGSSPSADIQYASVAGEYNSRQLFPMIQKWNEYIRYESGYLPIEPYKRDPGDYLVTSIQPIVEEGNRPPPVVNIPSISIEAQSEQTSEEALRDKYEGLMVVRAWPADANNDIVQQYSYKPDDWESGDPTTYGDDDLVNGVRMMINGYWFYAGSTETAMLYGATNGYNLSKIRRGHGRYGIWGFIEQLVREGGIEVLGSGLNNDGIIGTAGADHEVWDFAPHIRMVTFHAWRYKEYLDANGNKSPFDQEHLMPYEPRGSVKYYDVNQRNICRNLLLDEVDVASGLTLVEAAKQLKIDFTNNVTIPMTEFQNSLSNYKFYPEEIRSYINSIAVKLQRIYTTANENWQLTKGPFTIDQGTANTPYITGGTEIGTDTNFWQVMISNLSDAHENLCLTGHNKFMSEWAGKIQTLDSQHPLRNQSPENLVFFNQGTAKLDWKNIIFEENNAAIIYDKFQETESHLPPIGYNKKSFTEGTIANQPTKQQTYILVTYPDSWWDATLSKWERNKPWGDPINLGTVSMTYNNQGLYGNTPFDWDMKRMLDKAEVEQRAAGNFWLQYWNFLIADYVWEEIDQQIALQTVTKDSLLILRESYNTAFDFLNQSMNNMDDFIPSFSGNVPLTTLQGTINAHAAVYARRIYRHIQHMRAELYNFSDTPGTEKRNLVWPAEARSIINEMIPLGPNEDNNTRYDGLGLDIGQVAPIDPMAAETWEPVNAFGYSDGYSVQVFQGSISGFYKISCCNDSAAINYVGPGMAQNNSLYNDVGQYINANTIYDNDQGSCDFGNGAGQS